MNILDRAPDPDVDEPGRVRGRTSVVLLLLLFLGAGTVLRMKDFHQPWKNLDPMLDSGQGLKGFGGALYSSIARNHVRYGYGNTRLAMITCGGERTVEELAEYQYLNHPPLIGILLSFGFHIFGVHEWSARLVPLLFSVLSLWMLFVVCRLVAGTGPALIATALMATMPMAVYYGAFVEVQSFQVMFTSLLIFYLYWKWHLARRRGFYWGFLAVFLAGAFMDWPIYLLVFGLFLHHILTPGPRGRSRLIWILPVVVFTAFALNVAFIRYMAGGNPGSLIKAFNVETTCEAQLVTITREAWMMWPMALKNFFLRMYTLPVMLFTGVFILRALVGILIRRVPAGGSLVFAYFCMGAGYVALFPYGSTIHEYWSMYLIPVFAVATACILWEVSRLIPARIFRRLLVVAAVAGLAVFLGNRAWNRYAPLIEYDQSYYVKAGRALQRLTKPEDKVVILGFRTEQTFYTYYGDRTVDVELLDIEALGKNLDPTVLSGFEYVAIPGNIDLHPLKDSFGPHREVHNMVYRAMSSISKGVDAGPLILFRIPLN